VITRLGSRPGHPATRAYVERRTKEGLSKKEIIRCLKRCAQIEAYELDKAVSEGTRRFEKMLEKRGWEGEAAESTAPDAGEPIAASGDEEEIVNAPGRAGRA